jgi:chromosome partitioning protein
LQKRQEAWRKRGVTNTAASQSAQLPDIKAVRPDYRLQHILDQVRNDYDLIQIDGSSWLGLITINAFTGADGVIPPLRCDCYIFEGMEQLLDTFRLVHDHLNNKVMLFGIVVTMYDLHTNRSKEIVDEIGKHFSKVEFDTLIPKNIWLSETPT